ncbi:hypothetical protein SRHO_G00127490 [Serrasalmus rhombeus]
MRDKSYCTSIRIDKRDPGIFLCLQELSKEDSAVKQSGRVNTEQLLTAISPSAISSSTAAARRDRFR